MHQDYCDDSCVFEALGESSGLPHAQTDELEHVGCHVLRFNAVAILVRGFPPSKKCYSTWLPWFMSMRDFETRGKGNAMVGIQTAILAWVPHIR